MPEPPAGWGMPTPERAANTVDLTLEAMGWLLLFFSWSQPIFVM
jgi:hypothetical protein